MLYLNDLTSALLKKMAKEAGIKNWWKMTKEQMIEALQQTQPTVEEPTVETEENDNDSEDLITLKEITHMVGIKGTKARRILRKANIERPYKRWEWHKEEHRELVEKVKRLLK